MDGTQRPFWRDAKWIALYCMVLFGFAGFSGRPLTMHEARLPETSREMLARHDWLLPTSGGRPWLERPPLPHWIVISAMKLFGHDDRVWIVRLPSAVMGTITVLLTMYIARKWFDPTIGIVSACVLATSFKFYQYATLAEDDIYLAALVAAAAACFTRAEHEDRWPMGFARFLFVRHWSVWGFFVILGLSNLTKGPLLGIITLGCPVAVYALRNSSLFLRYSFIPGWILVIGLSIVWPLWAYHQYPDVVDNWKYDYLGRMSGTYAAINEPWWFYFGALPKAMAFWAPMCLLGLLVACVAFIRSYIFLSPSAELPSIPGLPAWVVEMADRTFARGSLWVACWAIVPLIVFSIPKGKHDHYLVPFLAPWAVLGAVGLVQLFRQLKLDMKRPILIAMPLLLIGYCAGEALFAARTDHTLDDTAFLIRCRDEVPANVPLYIDGKLGPPGNLDFFRMQFYSRPDAMLLHNLSFLRDEKITSPTVYVICRAGDRRLLERLGTVESIDHSPKSHEGETPPGLFTLFKLSFYPDLKRYPLPAYITSLQAMERASGPWCGPPLQ